MCLHSTLGRDQDLGAGLRLVIMLSELHTQVPDGLKELPSNLYVCMYICMYVCMYVCMYRLEIDELGHGFQKRDGTYICTCVHRWTDSTVTRSKITTWIGSYWDFWASL